MIARRTPAFSNTRSSRPSWPTRIHSIPSTSPAIAGSVSFSKAAATRRVTPAARAERARING